MCVSDRRKVFSASDCASVARDQLLGFRNAGWYWLHAYAVMPDHIHVLLKLIGTNRPLGKVVAVLKSAILFRVRALGTDFVWQDGFHDYVLRDNEDGDEIVAYILANPSRAGLVGQDEQYPYCGIVDRYR